MSEYYLAHHGIKGQKWGVRRFQNSDGSYTEAGKQRYGRISLNPITAYAQYQNYKVDKGFKKWKEGAANRDSAIELGKKANEAHRAYMADKSNKELKKAYKQANKEYKKALGKNTTYRKGTVRQEVGADRARKYLTDAKRIEKQLNDDPGNRDLQKQYNKLMHQHDVERARARNAQAVGAARSRRVAAMKRAATMSVKAAATAAIIGAGTKVVNDNFDINISSADVQKAMKLGKSVMRMAQYLY